MLKPPPATNISKSEGKQFRLIKINWTYRGAELLGLRGGCKLHQESAPPMQAAAAMMEWL